MIKRIRKPFKVIITREDGTHYLIRYNLFQCSLFEIKFHKILKSDDACLHDHPWNFVSFILWGGYVEHTNNGKKICHPLSILFRKAHHSHRLEIYQTCYTLVIVSKKTREWGFWTKDGWKEWFNYKQGSNQC